MPVPCLFPCELCGDKDVCLLHDEVKNIELRKKLCSQQICLSGCDTCDYRACVRCEKRSDFDFRMAVLNALVDYRKGEKK